MRFKWVGFGLSSTTNLQIPAKFATVFMPNSPDEFDTQGNLVKKGYKRRTFYIRLGGRASGKSHNFATAAVLRAYMGYERILCVREIMNTISQSLYRLLCDKIKELGLTDFFVITDTSIKVPHNGSSFIFKGLGSNVDESCRSVEGVTLTLCEESQAISEYSWSVLLPSVLRTEGSEVWIAFNPQTFEDPVYKRFIENFEPDRMDVEEVNYYDNPYLPKGIIEQVEADRKRDPETFENIWLGKPRSAREGGIFLPERIEIIEQAPPNLRLCRGWDIAGSAVKEKKNGVLTDPDHTVGLLMGVDHDAGIYYIIDVVRLRGTPDIVETAVKNTAALDGLGVLQSIAQEPGQAGIAQVQTYARLLSGYSMHSSPESGSKELRASPYASQVNARCVKMVRAPWNTVVVNEMKSFTGQKNGPHEDTVDAGSRAYSQLIQPRYMQKLRVF